MAPPPQIVEKKFWAPGTGRIGKGSLSYLILDDFLFEISHLGMLLPRDKQDLENYVKTYMNGFEKKTTPSELEHPHYHITYFYVPEAKRWADMDTSNSIRRIYPTIYLHHKDRDIIVMYRAGHCSFTSLEKNVEGNEISGSDMDEVIKVALRTLKHREYFSVREVDAFGFCTSFWCYSPNNQNPVLRSPQPTSRWDEVDGFAIFKWSVGQFSYIAQFNVPQSSVPISEDVIKNMFLHFLSLEKEASITLEDATVQLRIRKN